MVGNEKNLPLFHGNGTNDPKQYWFLCESVWRVRQNTNNDVKKGQLVTTLWGRVLDWYMKFIQVPKGTPAKTLDEVRKGKIEEFRKPKSKVQYIIEVKEIMQFSNETVSGFDQIFKTLMVRFIFQYEQHSTQRIVYHNIVISYPETANAIEDCDTERGSGDHDKVRGFTYWRKCSWHEPNSGTADKLDASVIGH